jgi:O-antigen ligase
LFLAAIVLIQLPALLRESQGGMAVGFDRSLPLLPILAAFCLGFLLWNLFRAGAAHDTSGAVREVFKLAVGMACLATVVCLAPRDARTLERMCEVLVWASAALMAVLIYQYAVVFGSPYLGSNLSEDTHEGKNQLAWYLVFVMPLVFAYLGMSPHKLRAVLPACVLTIAWIYIGSRGAWLSAASGIGGMVVLAAARDRSGALRKTVIALAMVGLVSAAAGWILVGVMDVAPEYVSARIRSFNPSDPEWSDANALRVYLLKNAIHAFQEAPVVGAGLTNVRVEGFVTHNDYLGILCETGLVGLLLFVGILGAAGGSLVLSGKSPASSAVESWGAWAARGSFLAVTVSLLFINAYTTSAFWIFTGLAISLRRATTDDGGNHNG